MIKKTIAIFKKYKLISMLLVSIVLSFILFANGVLGDFVFDDVAVVKNRGDLTDFSFFFDLFVSPYHQNMPKTGLYRPLTMASYSINHNILGGSAFSFHVVNVLIHALNSFLVFWLVKHFLKSKPFAYFTFLLFLAHPIHTEAVTSIVGRAELLAFLWSFLAIYFFVRNYKLLTAIFFLFAIWSKETAIIVLPLFLYISLYFKNKSFWLSLKNMSFLVIPLAIYSFFRYQALHQYFWGDVTSTIIENQLKFVGFFERIFTALKILYMYVERLIWPIHLSADYSYARIGIVSNIFQSLQSLLGAVVLMALIYLAVRYRKTNPSLSFGAILFLLPYLVISNLIKPVGTIMGERLMYFPSLGFVIICGYFLDKLYKINKKWSKFVISAVIMIAILYGARTIIRNNDWKDSRTLFFQTVKESPNSLITRTALAGIYIKENEWNKAREELEVAKKIYKDNSHLQNLLGIVADHEGDPGLAETHFKRSIELNPDAINSYVNLAELYFKYKRFDEASNNLLKVIEFYPVPEYVLRYAYAQIALSKPDEAINILNKYTGSNLKHPDVSAAIGTAYFVKRDYKEALVYLKNARDLGNRIEGVQEMIRIAESQLKL